MVKVSLVNPNFQTGPIHLNSYYLPYTAGTLWSYCMLSPILKKHLTIHNWIFKREPIEEAVLQCKDADVALLSCYIWNEKYSYLLAKRLKEENPNIKIIVGGPQVDHRDKDYFKKHPYIDSMVIGEGERAVQYLLECVVENSELPKRNSFERIKDLDLPSPYLTGVFDTLIADHPDIEWVPTIECDRGCPYACTFCDWGSATASKMYKFYIERITAEIDWIVDKGLTYINLTNSNFGIYKDRDLLIAQKIADCKRKTGLPHGVTVSYAKNNNASVLDIVQLFTDAKITTGITLSLQSATPQVLENIERKNMKLDKVKEISTMAKDRCVPVSTEIILGLPGETYQSFKDTLETVFQANIVAIDIFYLQLLINAPMYVNDRERFEIETFDAYDYFYDFDVDRIRIEKEQGYAESIKVIKSTQSMNNSDMLKSSLFAWFIVGNHCLGLSYFMSEYLHKQGIMYVDFYEKLLDYFINNNSNIKSWVDEYYNLHAKWYKDGYVNRAIGEMPNIGFAQINTFLPLIL